MTLIKEMVVNRECVYIAGPDTFFFQGLQQVVFPQDAAQFPIGKTAPMCTDTLRNIYPGKQGSLTGGALGHTGNSEQRVDRFYCDAITVAWEWRKEGQETGFGLIKGIMPFCFTDTDSIDKEKNQMAFLQHTLYIYSHSDNMRLRMILNRMQRFF